jgi:hypothetical protein
MDRRDALKRLAAGSATAVGASVIVSQPAFAYANPTVTGSPTVTITTTGALTATIAISNVPAGSCPGSALSKPAPSQVSLTWETFWPGNNQVMSTGTGTSVSISSLFQRWFVDDRIRVTMVYRYQCVYAGSTTTICVRWFREFRASSGGGSTTVWSLLTSTGPTTVACPASPLTASRSTGVEHTPGGRTEDGIPVS